MDRSAIIGKVKIRLDEVAPDNMGEIIEPETIDDLIEPNLRVVGLTAPVYLLDSIDFYQESSVDDNQVDNGDQTGYIYLPNDFLRLISFKMEIWNVPATRAISEHSQLYKKQKNTWTRGGLDKPICAIRHDPSSEKKILEYYSVQNDNHTIEHAYYFPVYSDEEGYTYGVENFQEDLIEPLVWLICADVFKIYERNDLSEICRNKVNEFYESNKL